MKVTVLHATPLEIIDKALTKCWDSECKIGQEMLDRIDRIGNKNKHASILEHVTINYEIKGISRALLQELARHRMANFSVKSTRYTLKELKDEQSFLDSTGLQKILKERMESGVSISEPYTDKEAPVVFDFARASKYLVFTNVIEVDVSSITALEMLRNVIAHGISNDKAKYCMPESYKVDLSFTINLRSLQNLLSLRTDKSALWEFRELANELYNVLEDNYKFLLSDSVKKYEE